MHRGWCAGRSWLVFAGTGTVFILCSKYGPLRILTCFFLVWVGLKVWALILKWCILGTEELQIMGSY